MRWAICPSHFYFSDNQTQPHHPISYFFGKKICQSVNYNKNGCKFAKRVNAQKAFYLVDLSSRAGARDLRKQHLKRFLLPMSS